MLEEEVRSGSCQRLQGGDGTLGRRRRQRRSSPRGDFAPTQERRPQMQWQTGHGAESSEKTNTHGGSLETLSSQEWAPTSAAPAGRPPSGARPAGGSSHLHHAAAALARSLRRQDPPGHSGAATVRVAARVLTNPAATAGGGREGWEEGEGLVGAEPGRARAAQIWAPSTLPHASAAGGRHGSATAHAVHPISTSPRANGRPPRHRALPPLQRAQQQRASTRTRAPPPPPTGEGFARRHPPATARRGRGRRGAWAAARVSPPESPLGATRGLGGVPGL